MTLGQRASLLLHFFYQPRKDQNIRLLVFMKLFILKHPLGAGTGKGRKKWGPPNDDKHSPPSHRLSNHITSTPQSVGPPQIKQRVFHLERCRFWAPLTQKLNNPTKQCCHVSSRIGPPQTLVSPPKCPPPHCVELGIWWAALAKDYTEKNFRSHCSSSISVHA